MEKDVLYEAGNVRVTYLHSPESGRENEVISGEDHELLLGRDRYVISRGILKELADVPERNIFELRRLLDVVNPLVFSSMQREDVGISEMGYIFRNAYQREEKLRDEWVRERRKERDSN